jgi:4,5-dihydroxyphthalate decarboxylase
VVGNLELSAAIRANPRSLPLITGEVQPQGIDLRVSVLEPSELYWRALAFEDFDIADLSFSSLMSSYGHGFDNWVPLPVSTQRQFFHTGAIARDAAGVKSPADLAGKRVGVSEYQQTGALWTRGIFQHEFGLDPKDVKWFMERPPEKSHGGATGFEPPEGIDLQYIDRDTNIGVMLQNGELDAAIMYNTSRNLVDRSTIEFGPGSGVSRLFNRRTEAARYFQKTGFFPINACVAIRREIVERHPWVVLNLYSAYLEAKERARRAARGDLEALLDAGVADSNTEHALDFDLYPYGVIANRELLETATQYSFEQGLVPRRFELSELFYPATLEL